MKRKAPSSQAAHTIQGPGTSVPAHAAGKPTNDNVNWLNAGLMVIAGGAAVVAPFQVFLWAYIILGPLHYLTEISWLHDRNYFTRRNVARRWWLALVFFTILVLVLAYMANTVSIEFQVALIYLVFAAAAAAIYVRDRMNAVALLVILAFGLFYLSGFQNYALAANLLVTIVHVFVFTGAFILLGALKSRSWVGVLSLVVFASCAIVAANVTAPYAAPSVRVRQLYAFGFDPLNRVLLRMFGRSPDVYGPAGVGAMRLIAFAYLYHYLNWFSKTSIIKWHEVTRSRGVGILGFWLAGGLAYLYNYQLGFGVYYILSMLHVFLEFPLNHQTFVDIGKSLRAGRWWAVGAPAHG